MQKRLRELVRIFKERAKYSPDWAKRADAAETRWRRLADCGPPPAPVVNQLAQIYAENVVGVTELIHSKTARSAVKFADAFKFRKEP